VLSQLDSPEPLPAVQDDQISGLSIAIVHTFCIQSGCYETVE